ncbi:glycerophosphodiester phosphodiesterase family protein [Chitinophaga japonensis]|uniref:Glycerophosphoryl diester phosphodiesterase n=1 Tax=Chitinophaga japonensis TaxID=104662 RepID=A0A562SZM7_CHIJA|nr:glycerophosphodiester phosphodiesterase family protein [Chitinophaga japonensis]TWI86702.1 glycerophosphoryl diester phosphodiesterase [Chitinophaga japonensis]
MKQALIVIFLLCCSRLLQAQSATALDSILEDFYRHPHRVLVAAHRAAHQHYPENSLAAIREAIRLGVDIVELDVRETKDSVLVIMHDKTITRTTGQPGAVKDYTYRELQQFPLLHNGQPTQERIPTFEQALQAVKGRVMLDIDFKEGSVEAAKKTCALVAATHTTRQVLFFLYAAKYASLLHQVDPDMPIMPRAHSAAETDTIMQQGKYAAIHIDDSFYSDTLVQRVRAHGERVWINALGRYDRMEMQEKGAGFDALRAQFPYANVIQTDLPGELVAYLKQEGLHR